MSMGASLETVMSGVAGLSRGVVVNFAGEVVTVVVPLQGADRSLRCGVLWSSETPLTLAEGDAVLVWAPSDEHGPGVIIGRVGPPRRPPAKPTLADELLIEAKQSLTLRVGDGSITLRADGKILISGRDLVSHAQRMNRIKGGAVSIN